MNISIYIVIDFFQKMTDCIFNTSEGSQLCGFTEGLGVADYVTSTERGMDILRSVTVNNMIFPRTGKIISSGGKY